MRILIVNNDTKHIDALKAMLSAHILNEISPSFISQEAITQSDLIILTGSHRNSLAGNEAFFAKELDLIRNCEKPIIGICLGLQLIAYAFEGFISRMPVKHHGIKHIQVVGHDPMFEGREYFRVYASHRWMVEQIDFPLIGLARSEDGWEIVKHASKKIYGFQFHPEVVEEGVADGKLLFNEVLRSLTIH